MMPVWITTYRKALVLAAVATAAGSAAWTVQGWRMGKALAQQDAQHQAATVRRTNVAIADWNKAAVDVAEALRLSKAKLASERLANKRALDALRLAQPQDSSYACRRLPLPDNYLETFRK